MGAEGESAESRLEGLRDHVTAKLHDRGELHLRQLRNGWVQVDLEPRSKASAPAYWLEMGHTQIILGVGQGGCRWELETSEADLRFAENVIDAVLDGSVVETVAPGRARLVVTLPNGERHKTAWAEAPEGCLPLPGWKFWGRTVRYSPYD